MSDAKQQTGLWIDIDVLSSNLNPIEKLVFADILVLSYDGKGFFKTNQVLADTFRVSLRTINYTMKSLVTKGLIKSHVTMPYGNGKKKRIITPLQGYVNKLKEL